VGHVHGRGWAVRLVPRADWQAHGPRLFGRAPRQHLRCHRVWRGSILDDAGWPHPVEKNSIVGSHSPSANRGAGPRQRHGGRLGASLERHWRPQLAKRVRREGAGPDSCWGIRLSGEQAR
ncbi:unnamed protein product, partial [Symbiodinium sp. CCMP2456]